MYTIILTTNALSFVALIAVWWEWASRMEEAERLENLATDKRIREKLQADRQAALDAKDGDVVPMWEPMPDYEPWAKPLTGRFDHLYRPQPWKHPQGPWDWPPNDNIWIQTTTTDNTGPTNT